MAVQATPAHAATFNVTKTADTADGACNSDCSLREAVIAANATATADTINIPAGYYEHEIIGFDDSSATGDLDITSVITFKGIGGTATIDAAGSDNVFDVVSGTAVFSNVNMVGAGKTGCPLPPEPGDPPPPRCKASGILVSGTAKIANSVVSDNAIGIAVESGGTVTLSQATVFANTDVGISNAGAASLSNSFVSNHRAVNTTALKIGISNIGTVNVPATLTVTHSTIRRNDTGIGNSNGTVSVENSTIARNGSAISTGGGSVSLTKTSVRRNDNRIVTGGSDRSPIRATGGSVTLIGSSVTENFGQSGGIAFNSPTGTLSLVNSTVSDNDAVGDGCTIKGVTDGTVSISTSIVSRNFGTGICLDGSQTANITGNRVTDNVGHSSDVGDEPPGGGIRILGGNVTVSTSTITGNAASHGGGVATDDDALTGITNSTISDNTARGTVIGAGAGGGVAVLSGSGGAVITNSTVSGNDATGHGGGIFVETGGASTLSSSTVSLNRSDSDSNNTGDGGGVRVESGGFLTLGNSILAGNTDGPPTTHPECSGPVSSSDNNLIGSTVGCAISAPGATNDDYFVTVELGPLANNGGPTQTHALLPGSDAIDHGPSSGPPAGDQRGVPRPQGPVLDTGSYELAFCGTQLVNVVGTESADNLAGTAQADGVLALGGNDTVRAKDGNDSLCGGFGNDKLFGENGNDKLFGEEGNDTLNGGAGTDSCVGGPGTNKLTSCP